MTIDQMSELLLTLKAKVGGDAEVPVLRVGAGENDYIVPSYGVACDLEDQDGNSFTCALVGKRSGEELSRVGVPHYEWNPNEDKVKTISDHGSDSNKSFEVNNSKDDTTLHIQVESAYWEDCDLNGESDDETHPRISGYNEKTGCLEWNIDINSGKILNWKPGDTAKVYYKVCDEFVYDYNGFHYGPNYVPNFMAIDDEGYGDYMYLTIVQDGSIKDWSKERFLSENSDLIEESDD